MIKITHLLIIFTLPIGSIVAGEAPTYEELQSQVAELRKEVDVLQGIVQGTAHPINLGRTSLASVTASSVNGGRPLNNAIYGILNAFDGGENWINDINYTYWLATGASGFVEVYFDVPLSLTSITIEGAPPFTTEIRFPDEGEAHYPRVSEQLVFETPLHSATAVRLTFDQDSGNLRVNEIKILGFVPPDIEYAIGIPRLFLTPYNANLMARAAYQGWISQFLPLQNSPLMQEEQDRFVYVYQRDTLDLLRVTIDKYSGEVTTEKLVQLSRRRSESTE